MIEPLDCSECKMEDRCEKTREACKYPEGRKYGVVHQRISILTQLQSRLAEADSIINSMYLWVNIGKPEDRTKYENIWIEDVEAYRNHPNKICDSCENKLDDCFPSENTCPYYKANHPKG